MTGERIGTEHLERLRRDGYTVVQRFLTPEELAAVQDDAGAYVPTWEEYARGPARYRHLAGGAHFVEFPFSGLALNMLFLHPELAAFAAKAIGTEDLYITQGHLWAKYAGTADFEQPLHRDYHNNTLVAPRHDGIYRQVPMMLYLTDVDEGLSPTHVVANPDAAHVRPEEAFFRREDHPELYERERTITAPAGSLLIYDVATIHRGSALTATEGARLTYHFVYRAAGLEWMGWAGWPKMASTRHMQAVLQAATPSQRSLLGFPRPGDPYWTEDTIARTAFRYPEMDMAPYRDAMVTSP